MGSTNQLIGMKAGAIFAVVAGFFFMFLHLFLKKDGWRQKLWAWRRSDALSAEAFRYTISILVVLAIGHMIVTVLQRLSPR